MARALRIFVSSPGDVIPERRRAQLVIEKLAKIYARFFAIEPILWEVEPMLASGHFQDQITPPSETDIVVLIGDAADRGDARARPDDRLPLLRPGHPAHPGFIPHRPCRDGLRRGTQRYDRIPRDQERHCAHPDTRARADPPSGRRHSSCRADPQRRQACRSSGPSDRRPITRRACIQNPRRGRPVSVRGSPFRKRGTSSSSHR